MNACRARHGGLATQLLFASAHAGMHLAAAIGLMLLLELATETCIRCAARLAFRGTFHIAKPRWYSS